MRIDPDSKDKKQARTLAIVLTGLVGLLVIAALAAVSGLGPALAPGLGLKSAAIIAFLVTVVLMIVFTVAAGDGLLGELQYMLLGFFGFFLIFWLMIAWIF